MSKISDATTVTEDNGLVLGAREKNAAIDGTLANDIEKISGKLGNLLMFRSNWLQGGSENLTVTHLSNDLYKYPYNLESAPDGYEFLVAFPYIEWFSSNEYRGSLFIRPYLLSQVGEAHISFPDANGQDVPNIPIVCSALQLFIKI